MSTMEAVKPVLSNNDSDEVRTHIVMRENGDPRPAHAIVTEAMIEGKEVVALCGYRWIPFRDPQKHPLCEDCLRIADLIFG